MAPKREQVQTTAASIGLQPKMARNCKFFSRLVLIQT